MGEVVGAGLVSHVPTIMLPKEIRYELNEGKEISIEPLKPDTIIVFDTHWGSLIEFIITSDDRREGKFTSEELPRGMCQVPYDLKGDRELANHISDTVNAKGVRTTPIDDPYLPIKYATVNIAHYLNQGEAWLSIGMLQSGQTDDYLAFGAALGEAIRSSDRRVVLLASGSMSHTFYPFKELDKHESSDPSHIFTPEAREADLERIEWFKQGNHAAVIDTMPAFLKHKPEGRFGHYLMMAAAIGGRDCIAKGQQYSDYENAVGTSQVHVWFDKPELMISARRMVSSKTSLSMPSCHASGPLFGVSDKTSSLALYAAHSSSF